MYQHGQGVPRDYNTAVKWYLLAAEQGFAYAQTKLGSMYATGQGVMLNSVYAHMWGSLGATNGNEMGARLRDDVEQNMLAAQISEAQKLAFECIRKDYKRC